MFYFVQTLEREAFLQTKDLSAGLPSPRKVLLSLLSSQVLTFKFLDWLLETCSHQESCSSSILCAQTSQLFSENEIGLKNYSWRGRQTISVHFWFLFSPDPGIWALTFLHFSLDSHWWSSYLDLFHFCLLLTLESSGWLDWLLLIFLLFQFGSMNVDSLAPKLGLIFVLDHSLLWNAAALVLSSSWLWFALTVVCGLCLHIKSSPGLTMDVFWEFTNCNS